MSRFAHQINNLFLFYFYFRKFNENTLTQMDYDDYFGGQDDQMNFDPEEATQMEKDEQQRRELMQNMKATNNSEL